MHTVCTIVSVTGISVTVNGFDLFPLMVISVTLITLAGNLHPAWINYNKDCNTIVIK